MALPPAFARLEQRGADVKLLNILIIELYDFVSGQNVDRGGGLIVKAKLHPQW